MIKSLPKFYSLYDTVYTVQSFGGWFTLFQVTWFEIMTKGEELVNTVYRHIVNIISGLLHIAIVLLISYILHIINVFFMNERHLPDF